MINGQFDTLAPTFLPQNPGAAIVSLKWLSQTIALNGSAQTITPSSGTVIRVTGSTASSTINLPASPTTDQVVVIDNQSTPTAGFTLSGNGKNIDGVASVNIPGRLSPRILTYNGTQWDTISGAFPLSFTWTPTVVDAGGTLVPVYTTQTGKGSVLGDLVFLEFNIAWSGKSGGSGNLRVGGVPYTPASGEVAAGIANQATSSLVAVGLDIGTFTAGVITFVKSFATPVTIADMAGAGSISGSIWFKL